MIELYFDGSCWPNPDGIARIGVVIKQDGQVIEQISEHLGSGLGMTNNLAEYAALKAGLEYLIKQGLTNEETTIYGDSLMVIKQMIRGTQINLKHLKPYKPTANQTIPLKQQFRSISFQWIPRELNGHADYLSNPSEGLAVV